MWLEWQINVCVSPAGWSVYYRIAVRHKQRRSAALFPTPLACSSAVVISLTRSHWAATWNINIYTMYRDKYMYGIRVFVCVHTGYYHKTQAYTHRHAPICINSFCWTVIFALYWQHTQQFELGMQFLRNFLIWQSAASAARFPLSIDLSVATRPVSDEMTAICQISSVYTTCNLQHST